MGASWLAGDLGRGRIGVGAATVRAALAASAPAAAPGLTVAEVDATLGRIAAAAGAGSAAARRRELDVLLARATPPERVFLGALLLGDLRQGALEGVLAEAVARAAGLPPEEVRRAAMLAGALAPVAEAALAEGAAGLARFRLRVGEPVSPMLAQSAADVDDALRQLGGEAALEWKLDGARVQAHKDGDAIRVFSRSLREVTGALPEVVALLRALPARSLVLDGEAIALRTDGTPEPFQVTMRRFGRKLDVERLAPDLPLSAFFFDALVAGRRRAAGVPGAGALGRARARAPGEPPRPAARHRRPGRGPRPSWTTRWRAARRASWRRRSTRPTRRDGAGPPGSR